MALPAPSPSSTALVTGASSGIGEAIARELASRGHGVTLVARREERLRALATDVADAHGVRAEMIAADLGETAGRDRLADTVDELGLDVEILVNNAGFGDSADFVDADRERLVELVRLNCEALLDLQARYLPGMVERGRGAIINIASTAAFQPMPSNATYAASKAFVLNLSKAVHEELRGTGVTLTAVCPGPVRTEFMDHADLTDASEKVPEFFWTSPQELAKDAVEAAAKGKRAVVPGLINRAGAIAGQHSPRGLATGYLERRSRTTSSPPRPESAPATSSGTAISTITGARNSVTRVSIAKAARPRPARGRSRPARTSRAKFSWKVKALTIVCHIHAWQRPQRAQRSSSTSRPARSASARRDSGVRYRRRDAGSSAAQWRPPRPAWKLRRFAARSSSCPDGVACAPSTSAERTSSCVIPDAIPSPQRSQRSSRVGSSSRPRTSSQP